MIAGLLAPALAAALLGPGLADASVAAEPAPEAGGVPVAQPELRPVSQRGVELTATIPPLFVEGQPFVVSLQVTATGKSAADLPAWMLTPAAWAMDGKALGRRPAKASVPLQPGQTLTVDLDLAALVRERQARPKDFSLAIEGKRDTKQQVIWLGAPDAETDYTSLSDEQLEEYQAVLFTSGGPIWVELWPDVAPNHVRNFLDLCASGFYDGSPFHRVIPGFMAQVGRSKDGTPAPRKLKAEFNSRRHVAGVLSAARLGNDLDSAESEFFIVHRPSPHLDQTYSAFGQILTGMDAVERVVQAVEGNQRLLDALKKNGVRIDDRRPQVAMALHDPFPAQSIERAVVVRATRSRPKK